MIKKNGGQDLAVKISKSRAVMANFLLLSSIFALPIICMPTAQAATQNFNPNSPSLQSPATENANGSGNLTSGGAINFDEKMFDANNSSDNPSNPQVLPVNQAFTVIASQQGDTLTLRFEVKDGYYLYQNKIKLDLPANVTASPLQFSVTPHTVDDPDFGKVPVFDQSFTATSKITTASATTGTLPPLSTEGVVKWQGCAKAGLCYPPQKTPLALSPSSENSPANSPTKIASASPMANKATGNNLTQFTADNDPFGLVAHPLWAMALLFLAGLGLAFTPCVLPMLPIVANIIARQHQPSAKKGLMLTASYGLGVAISYGMLGAMIAVFGASLGVINWLQKPAILLSFAALFVLLGLYMLDRLPIRLPASLGQQLNKLTQIGENRLGSVTGSLITGFFSALVVSPCVSAPLAGALAGVATAGNPVVGFFALFMLGLGLSTPLILLGATQGNFMPKSGGWMTWVKTGFALLLFAVALLLVERVFMSRWLLGLWAVWFAVVAVWLWQWTGNKGGNQPQEKSQLQEKSRNNLLTKALALMVAAWSMCLLVGMALGSTDSWQPLKPLLEKNAAMTNTPVSPNPPTNTVTPAVQTIHQMSELTPILAAKPNVLVDVTAEWCIECRIMDKNLFATPPAALQNWHIVRLDVTEDTPQSRAVYEQLKIFGPPVLLYYRNATLVNRQNGEVKRDAFEQSLAKF